MEHRGTRILETERLILRPLTEQDAQAVYTNWASDDEVTRYLSWPTHTGVEASLGFMRWCVESYSRPDSYQWGIVLKETGVLIGNISVVRVTEETTSAELGWVLGRRWWGNGYMPEAAKCVIAFLFDEVGFNRICAKHDVNNPKSGRVMQKAGMRYEGTLRGSSRNNQGIVDCAYYAILRRDTVKPEFRRFSEFPPGTLYELLRDAYSFDPRYQAVWNDNWVESDAFFRDNPEIADRCGLVTCVDGVPIGFVTWDPRNRPEYVEIGHNGIREAYKRQGYGQAQLREALRRIRLYEGLKRVTVCTNSAMAAPRNYEAAGFVLYDRKENTGESSFAGDYLYYELRL